MTCKPKIFIGSSREGLKVAYALQSQLEYETEPIVWTQGVFRLSSNTFDDLIATIKSVEYALYVFTPDDKVIIRDNDKNIVRDNVIYEFGLSVGILGKDRVFIIKPRDANNVFHLPTDLLGLNVGEYDGNRSDGNIEASLGPIVFRILSRVKTERLSVEKKVSFDIEDSVIKNSFISGHGVLWNMLNGVLEETVYCPDCKRALSEFPPGSNELLVCSKCDFIAPFRPKEIKNRMKLVVI